MLLQQMMCRTPVAASGGTFALRSFLGGRYAYDPSPSTTTFASVPAGTLVIANVMGASTSMVTSTGSTWTRVPSPASNHSVFYSVLGAATTSFNVTNTRYVDFSTSAMSFDIPVGKTVKVAGYQTGVGKQGNVTDTITTALAERDYLLYHAVARTANASATLTPDVGYTMIQSSGAPIVGTTRNGGQYKIARVSGPQSATYVLPAQSYYNAVNLLTAFYLD